MPYMIKDISVPNIRLSYEGAADKIPEIGNWIIKLLTEITYANYLWVIDPTDIGIVVKCRRVSLTDIKIYPFNTFIYYKTNVRFAVAELCHLIERCENHDLAQKVMIGKMTQEEYFDTSRFTNSNDA
jgi:hypothetical protein